MQNNLLKLHRITYAVAMPRPQKKIVKNYLPLIHVIVKHNIMMMDIMNNVLSVIILA